MRVRRSMHLVNPPPICMMFQLSCWSVTLLIHVVQNHADQNHALNSKKIQENDREVFGKTISQTSRSDKWFSLFSGRKKQEEDFLNYSNITFLKD